MVLVTFVSKKFLKEHGAYLALKPKLAHLTDSERKERRESNTDAIRQCKRVKMHFTIKHKDGKITKYSSSDYCEKYCGSEERGGDCSSQGSSLDEEDGSGKHCYTINNYSPPDKNKGDGSSEARGEMGDSSFNGSETQDSLDPLFASDYNSDDGGLEIRVEAGDSSFNGSETQDSSVPSFASDYNSDDVGLEISEK